MILDIIGLFFVLFGVFFSWVGILGNIRFPDVYSRIHASGKVSSLGIINFLFGSAFLMPEATLKVFLLGIFMLISTPVASHVIALAAHRAGVPRLNAFRDDLTEHQSNLE
jgi:multicomponent Na+:H+ antiporter subunit G